MYAAPTWRAFWPRPKTIGTLVTIDMESTEYTDRTLAIYRDLRHEFDNVGIVIQSYLYRSEADIVALCQEGAHVRLCKGAYKEPPIHAFPKKADVDASLRAPDEDAAQPGGARQQNVGAIATHDVKMIEATCQYAQEQLVPRDEFEFQMLHGIRRDLQTATRRRRLWRARVRALRHGVVSVLHAPPGRAPGERLVHREQLLPKCNVKWMPDCNKIIALSDRRCAPGRESDRAGAGPHPARTS